MMCFNLIEIVTSALSGVFITGGKGWVGLKHSYKTLTKEWLAPTSKALDWRDRVRKICRAFSKTSLIQQNAPNILSGALQLKTFNLPHRSVSSTIIQLIKYRDIVNFTVKEWDSSIKYFKVWAISDSSILSKYKYLTEWECEIFHLSFIKYIIYVYFMFSCFM